MHCCHCKVVFVCGHFTLLDNYIVFQSRPSNSVSLPLRLNICLRLFLCCCSSLCPIRPWIVFFFCVLVLVHFATRGAVKLGVDGGWSVLSPPPAENVLCPVRPNTLLQCWLCPPSLCARATLLHRALQAYVWQRPPLCTNFVCSGPLDVFRQ